MSLNISEMEERITKLEAALHVANREIDTLTEKQKTDEARIYVLRQDIAKCADISARTCGTLVELMKVLNNHLGQHQADLEEELNLTA